MLKPTDNTGGYQSTSILPKASKLQDVDYLLIHGTGDGKGYHVHNSLGSAVTVLFLPLDNVHYQHTAQLAEALTQADVQFRMQVSSRNYSANYVMGINRNSSHCLFC